MLTQIETAPIEAVSLNNNNKLIMLKIDETDIFIQEHGDGRGKITISNTYGKNYSYYWGSMHGTMVDFLKSMSSDYFAGKLLGAKSSYDMDVKATFKAIRRHIADEIGLKWYEHMEFQKDMREKLNEFQHQIESDQSQELFVYKFPQFIDNLDYYLIEDSPVYSYHTRNSLEREFKNISECWGFIQTKVSAEHHWLENLHNKIKKKLKNGKLH